MPSDPTLWLYTSLTAGSSHIITATSRIETILKANKIPFKAVDCATDDKARMLWARRSKGRKIPGLVKFNDVIADLEQVEEWNEYGELEEQIEDQIDIFGDVPISATAAEAQAAAAARAQAQEEAKKSAATGTGRTASETRHISISEPKDSKRKESDATPTQEKKDSPLSMAMRQAGVEAAAKAGQKKPAPAAAATSTTKSETAKTPEAVAAKEVMPPPAIPASVAAAAPKLEMDAADPDTTMTDAKTPIQLASEGAKKTSVDKINSTSPDEEGTLNQSNPAQLIEQRRKSSVPTTPSSLAKTTSIDEAHTVTAEPAKPKATATSSTEIKKAEPAKAASTSTPVKAPAAAAPASKAATGTQKPVPATKKTEEEDDDDDEDDEDEEDDSDEEDEDEEEEDEKSRPTKAAKIGATSKEEEKVLKGTKPQQAAAKDPSQAGVSVAD